MTETNDRVFQLSPISLRYFVRINNMHVAKGGLWECIPTELGKISISSLHLWLQIAGCRLKLRSISYENAPKCNISIEKLECSG